MSNTYNSDTVPQQAFYRRRTRLIHHLVIVLFEEYQVYGGVDLLRATLSLVQLGLQLAIICGENSYKPALFTYLGHVDFALYETTADSNALAESIRVYRKVWRDTKPGDRYRTESGLGLAVSRFNHLKRQGMREERASLLEDLEKVLHQAVGGPLHAYAFAVYVTITTDRYMLPPEGVTIDTKRRHLASLKELQDHATSISQSITIWSVQAEMMYHIASATSDLHLMDEGIQLCCLALRHISTLHPLGFQFLRFYGSFYNLRGVFLDNPSDLESASSIAEEAVGVPGLSPGARSGALYMWAQGVVIRADRTGDLDILERGINGIREARLLLSPQNAFQGAIAALLARALRIHFENRGQMPALDHIITLCDRNTDLIQRQPQLAVNIAEAMIIRAQTVDHRRTQQLLNDAIGLLQSRMPYISTAGDATGERANADLQLVRASLMQARCGLDPALDPHTVLGLARECLSLCTAIQRPTAVTHLSDVLLSQALRTGDKSFLEQAQALLDNEVPYECGSWCQAHYCAARAGALLVRHMLTGVADHLTGAWSQFRAAVAMGSGRARDQFYFSMRWAESARELGHLDVALEAYRRSIDLIPEVVFLGQSVVGRIESVRQANGLACSSATLALTLNDVASAVSFLEQARGITWSQLRRSSHPPIEELPEALRAKLSSAVMHEQEIVQMDWTTRRHKAENLSKIIKHIRSTPGFERFLLPPTLSDIVKTLQSVNGYASVLIPSESYCDVVLLGTPNDLGCRHMRLSSMNTRRLLELNKQFSTAFSAVRSGQPVIKRKIASMSVNVALRGDTSEEVLSILWRDLVHPILLGLEVKASIMTTKPRMWWCPTGVMTCLPLHAAGVYTGNSQNATSDYVTSSYVPTLSTLHSILDRQTSSLNAAPLPTPAQLLLLASGAPHNGRSPLPNALVEAEAVREVASDVHNINAPGKAMSVQDALAALPEANIMHMACHGSQDQSDPLNSGFDLDDGRMTLGQLIGMTLPRAQLAYLSACDSAAIDESRPDESINLAATMLAVGFKSILATMWSMSDMDGPFIARRVYQNIIRDGCLVPSMVPLALENAVRELRETGVSPSRWATYIHVGV